MKNLEELAKELREKTTHRAYILRKMFFLTENKESYSDLIHDLTVTNDEIEQVEAEYYLQKMLSTANKEKIQLYTCDSDALTSKDVFKLSNGHRLNFIEDGNLFNRFSRITYKILDDNYLYVMFHRLDDRCSHEYYIIWQVDNAADPLENILFSVIEELKDPIIF